MTTPLSPLEMAALATGYFFLVAPMLTPVFVLTGKLALFAGKLTLAAGKLAAWYGALAGLTHLRQRAIEWLLAAALAAAGLTLATPAPAHAAERPAVVASAPVVAPPPSAERAVADLYLLVTRNTGKPMPVWLLDSAARVYTAYRTYRNGQQVEEATRIARSALGEVAALRAEIEAGRQIGAREQKVFEARLAAQVERIDALARRVGRLEQTVGRQGRQGARVAKIVTRRGCPRFHAFDKRTRRCIDRQ